MALKTLSSRMRRLRTQFAVVLALAMAPMGVIALLQAVSNAQIEVTQRIELLETAARRAAEGERDAMIEIRESLRSAAAAFNEKDIAADGCVSFLSGLAETRSWLTRAVVLDVDGRALCGSEANINVANLPEWSDFKSWPRFLVGVARTGRFSETQVLTAYHPFPRTKGQVYALAVGIDLDFLQRLADIGSSGRPFALLDQSGAVVANNAQASSGWLPLDRETLLTYADQTISGRGVDRVERIYFTHPLVAWQMWAVSGTAPVGIAEIIFSWQGLTVLAPVALWLIAVGVAYVAIDQLVSRHVSYLEKVAAKIGGGDLTAQIRSFDNAPTEIARLGDAVKTMAQNLAERDAKLRESMAVQHSLLLEVHHRVKNNLQMISSLMNLQLRRSNNPAEQESLQLVQDRIHGLALVHQNLYATERLDHVALDQLVRDLGAHLETSLRPSRTSARLTYRLDPVTVGADVATPVALFLTEALGNVFKHAMAGKARTEVRVQLSDRGEHFELSVENDLPGMVPKADPEQVTPLGATSGLGSRLMDGFARQIAGTCERHCVDGRHRVTLVAPKSPRAGAFEMRPGRREQVG